jgi:hypothetical protein
MENKIKFVDHITTYSELALAVVGVLTAVWIGMKKLYRMARNIESLVEQSTANSRKLTHIEHQMKLNGGMSLRDAVHRIEVNQQEMGKRLEEIEHLPCHLHMLADKREAELK